MFSHGEVDQLLQLGVGCNTLESPFFRFLPLEPQEQKGPSTIPFDELSTLQCRETRSDTLFHVVVLVLPMSRSQFESAHQSQRAGTPPSCNAHSRENDQFTHLLHCESARYANTQGGSWLYTSPDYSFMCWMINSNFKRFQKFCY